MDAAGVLLRFTGVHDCWKPYFGYPMAHALCSAYLCRELTGVWETTGQSWAAKLICCLEQLNAAAYHARRCGHDQIDAPLRAGLHRKYDLLVAQCSASCACCGPRIPSPRGEHRPLR